MKRSLILIFLYLLFSINEYSQTVQFSDYEPTVYKGSTAVENLYCASLEGNLQGNPTTQPVKVYLPPGYDKFPHNAYPVVYLLHGYDGFYNTYYNSYDLLDKLNTLISSKTIIPLIIVTPNAFTIYLGSHYANSYVSGNWEDYIVQDVIHSIESKYRILDEQKYRGIAGFSMGASGAAKIAMKHASLFNSVGLIGGASLDLEEQHFKISANLENMIKAARINEYRDSDPMGVRRCFSFAVALAPDSSSHPVMGRLPVDADGILIDSIWQRWLMHDPKTMLADYGDSLLKLQAIQMYIGEIDEAFAASESFHQALLDLGIEHGNEIYPGGHSPVPVLDDVLVFLSEYLASVVPNIQIFSDYYLENTDILVAEADMDGKIYIVPEMADPTTDSIFEFKAATAEVLAEVESEIELAELEYGRYHVYAISNDSAVSNIPEEFCLVPDKSPPALDLLKDTVAKGDSIRVSLSRDGTLCLIGPVAGLDTFRTVPEILNSPRLKSSVYVTADEEVALSTSSLALTAYWIYGYDQYGIVSAPESVEIVEPAGIIAENQPKIELFPNPVNGTVEILVNTLQPYEMIITALNSLQVYSRRMEGNSHLIDLSSFQKGIYFITIRSKDFVTTRKIIKI